MLHLFLLLGSSKVRTQVILAICWSTYTDCITVAIAYGIGPEARWGHQECTCHASEHTLPTIQLSSSPSLWHICLVRTQELRGVPQMCTSHILLIANPTQAPNNAVAVVSCVLSRTLRDSSTNCTSPIAEALVHWFLHHTPAFITECESTHTIGKNYVQTLYWCTHNNHEN